MKGLPRLFWNSVRGDKFTFFPHLCSPRDLTIRSLPLQEFIFYILLTVEKDFLPYMDWVYSSESDRSFPFFEYLGPGQYPRPPGSFETFPRGIKRPPLFFGPLSLPIILTPSSISPVSSMFPRSFPLFPQGHAMLRPCTPSKSFELWSVVEFLPSIGKGFSRRRLR